MKIVAASLPKTGADRQKRYRERTPGYNAKHQAYKRNARVQAIPEFIGVDSEGIGSGTNHRAVLLGVGTEHYIAADTRKGLQWQEVFEFLYSQFETRPKAAFVGFFLSYDFNQWLRSLPRDKAWMLLSKQGKAQRIMPDNGTGPKRRNMYPVRVGGADGWEIDTLGFKRLSIRPRVCTCPEDGIKCEHDQKPWMHICDSGPFYQMAFAQVTDDAMWKQDPEGPICTKEEWTKLFAGKNRRSYAKLDKRMIDYNALENVLLARVMSRLAKAFASIGIKLAKDQWYGPGSTANAWLKSHDSTKHAELENIVDDWFLDICRKSYFGGWFEIFSHGSILGESFNYDINNAYPYATTKLPHLCDECECRRGNGNPESTGDYVLVYATVYAGSNRIGPMPYRDSKGSILRPAIAKGWYWQSELGAANRAGILKSATIHEWVEFIPCEHPKPFTEIQALYDLRLKVGKASAQGMAIKLNNNSLYGKFAQSVGSAPYNNWFYASFVTSHCRTQILDAIATHPGGPESVLMVATDGICFDSPHPTLRVSKTLGEWERSVYIDLCLFKPGVYWHKEGKEALLKCKTRGVPKKEFQHGIELIEMQFNYMHEEGKFPGSLISKAAAQYGFDEFDIRTEKGWPFFYVEVNFRMKSCLQALNEGDWERAAVVQEKVPVLQDSDPQNKRRRPRYNMEKRRIDTVIHDLPLSEIETKYYGEVRYPVMKDIGFGFEGSAIDDYKEGLVLLRNKPSEMGYGEDIVWDNVWGGEA
jgi:hypothetical protein